MTEEQYVRLVGGTCDGEVVLVRQTPYRRLFDDNDPVRSEFYDFVDKDTVNDPQHGTIRIMRFRNPLLRRSDLADLGPTVQYEGPAEISIERRGFGFRSFDVDVHLTRYGNLRETARNIWFSGMDMTEDEPIRLELPTRWDGDIIHISSRNLRRLQPEQVTRFDLRLPDGGVGTAVIWSGTHLDGIGLAPF